MLSPAALSPNGGPIVDVDDLVVEFRQREGVSRAVNGIGFRLDAGEVLCILGESGSGKSVTLRALMRLLPPARTRMSGRLQVGGTDIVTASERTLRGLRGSTIAMVFQEPMTAFDPVYTIGDQIGEAVARHRGVSLRDGRARALEMLELVQVPSAKRRLDAYPHELSGGLRQRAMIALALSCSPRVLLADEPTTALDATVQAQILLLLRGLQKELGMAVIFVTHDLGVAAEVADRVAVMYAGRFVETGTAREVLRGAAHPYTRGLMASTVHGQARGTRLSTIPGSPPDLRALPPGCSFAPRCDRVTAACHAAVPAARESAPGRMVRCLHADQLVPA